MFNSNGNRFVNPFEKKAEIDAFEARIDKRYAQEKVNKQTEADQVILHRVSDRDGLAATLETVRSNGRTPLIVSAFENPAEVDEILALSGEDQSVARDIYLREIGLAYEKEGLGSWT